MKAIFKTTDRQMLRTVGMNTRSCHFTFDLCKTSDSNLEWYLTQELIVQTNLSTINKVQSRKND